MNQSELEDTLRNLTDLQGRHDDGEHHIEYNEEDAAQDAYDLNVAKATAMIVLFTASTICGSIPFLLNKHFKWTENNTNARSAIVVKCMLYFGGGVLLCTTFLHLLPEVSENIEELQNEKKLPTFVFRLPELLTCLGFFAMFLVEELIHAYIHRHKKSLDQDKAVSAFQRGRSVRNSFLVRGRKTIDKKDENNSSDKSGALSVLNLITNDVENQKFQTIETPDVNGRTASETPPESQNNSTAPNNHHHHRHDFHHGHSHLPVNNLDEDTIVSSLRGLLIVLALSLHELFEGLAVGLESSASNVWYMFGAVSAHKLVLAFCVGVELIVTRTKFWLAIVYVVTFAVVSPIGIGIGILVTNEENAASAIPSAILQGLATGTLLYVVFFEILSKENSGIVAYFAFVAGFLVMFGLQFATGHQHSHSHGHGHSHEHDDHAALNHEHDHQGPDHSEMKQNLDDQIRVIKDIFDNLRHQRND